MIDALLLGGNMKLNEYQIESCIDYIKLKEIRGGKLICLQEHKIRL